MHVQLTTTKGAPPTTLSLRLPTVIGRGKDTKVRVRQAWVSRHHCALYCEDQQLLVRDLGSSNGTFLNESRVERSHRVQPGDRLRVGKVTFRIDFVTATVTSSLEKPDTPAEPPIVASPPEDGNVMVRYDEKNDGSFVRIDTGQPAVNPIDDFPELNGPGPASPVDGFSSIAVGPVKGPARVQDDESALNRFLENLDP